MASSRPSSTDSTSIRPRFDPVDLRALEYVGTYDHNLMCSICHCPFVYPIELGCEHVFCHRCINQAMKHQQEIRQPRSCPSCRRLIELDSISTVPKILESILDELRVKCPLSGHGCDEEMPRSCVQDHLLRYCDHYEIECPSEICSLPVERKHVTADRCLHYPTPCEDCSRFVMEKDLEIHRTQCQMARTACPDCKEQVPVRGLEAHIERCPDAMFPCSASSFGCGFVAKRITLNKHLKDCPLNKLVPLLQKQNDRLEAHEIALKKLRHKNSILESSFSAIQETLASTSLVDAPPLSASTPDSGPFESTAHHLLCLHESLRKEVDRLSATLAEVDAKNTLMIINENLLLKDDLAHTNAAIGSLRMQVQWLVNSRLQSQQRVAMAKTPVSGEGCSVGTSSATGSAGESSATPARRLSDSTRQDTKL